MSATKELRWDTSGLGFFTIDTPGTKGAVGFAPGRLNDVMIELNSPDASVLLTALDKSSTLGDTKRALLSIVARNCKADFKYFATDHRILDAGQGLGCSNRSKPKSPSDAAPSPSSAS